MRARTPLAVPDRPVVLESFARPGDRTNPYLVQLLEGLSARTSVHTFSWSTALLGSYDVFHLHLPDAMVRRSTRSRTWSARILFLLLLLRCRWRGVAVVRTLHNLKPHEDWGAVDRWLLRRADRATDWWITINPVDEPPVPGRCSQILHGHYRSWYADLDVPPAEAGRACFFGLVRPYKGVVDLVRCFGEVDDPSYRLVVAGAAQGEGLSEQLEAMAAGDPRVELVLEYLSDEQVVAVVGGSGLVVLPYRELRNSGAALLALSLDRPVLLPRGDITELLRDEVGPAWVHLYDGALSAEVLHSTMEAVRSVGRGPQNRPALGAREWSNAAEDHLRAFRCGLAHRRGPR